MSESEKIWGLSVVLDENIKPGEYEFVDSLATAHARRAAREVEQRLRDGENYFTASNVVYSVPRWREHPITRFKIEWLRRR